jgi:probable phosphoglycerate mutase
MKLLLIRHGETEWSRSRRHTGRTDVPLLPDGEAMARALVPVLAREEFDLVLVSPLERARRTAELAGLGAAAEYVDDLMEWDYGDVEGRTTAELRETQPGWDIWADGAPGGESLAEVGARADRVVARLLDEGPERVAVVAHGHLLRIFAARWAGLDPSAGGRLALSTAAVCELGFERERRVVRRWNDTSHLGDP